MSIYIVVDLHYCFCLFTLLLGVIFHSNCTTLLLFMLLLYVAFWTYFEEFTYIYSRFVDSYMVVTFRDGKSAMSAKKLDKTEVRKNKCLWNFVLLP